MSPVLQFTHCFIYGSTRGSYYRLYPWVELNVWFYLGLFLPSPFRLSFYYQSLSEAFHLIHLACGTPPHPGPQKAGLAVNVLYKAFLSGETSVLKQCQRVEEKLMCYVVSLKMVRDCIDAVSTLSNTSLCNCTCRKNQNTSCILSLNAIQKQDRSWVHCCCQVPCSNISYLCLCRHSLRRQSYMEYSSQQPLVPPQELIGLSRTSSVFLSLGLCWIPLENNSPLLYLFPYKRYRNRGHF